jgi:hypothetical protein
MSRDHSGEFYDEGGSDEYETATGTDATRPSTVGTLPVSWPFGYGRDHDYEGEAYDEADADDSLLDEGLITAALVAGLLLFVFPEPATSALGAALIVAGGIAWLADWAS